MCAIKCGCVYPKAENSALGPLTPDPMPQLCSALSKKLFHAQICASSGTMVSASAHTYLMTKCKAETETRTPRLLYSNHNLYNSRAELEEKREEFLSSPVSERKAEVRNTMR